MYIPHLDEMSRKRFRLQDFLDTNCNGIKCVNNEYKTYIKKHLLAGKCIKVLLH